MNKLHLYIFLVSIAILTLFMVYPFLGSQSSSTSYSENVSEIPVYTFKIVGIYPHDLEAFTQGLAFEDGFLYESTGLQGRSSLRKVELQTGKVVQKRELPYQFFGEGITIFENRVIQLTWKSNLGFVYDKDKFGLIQEFKYKTEGWGITNDGKNLIMSDGTSILYVLDPWALNEINRIYVYDQNGPVSNLNELEYIKGEIYANIWPTNHIVRISPQTGRVTGWIDLGELHTQAEGLSSQINVLNGIAYDEKNDRLFVTGKLWSKLYEITLLKK